MPRLGRKKEAEFLSRLNEGQDLSTLMNEYRIGQETVQRLLLQNRREEIISVEVLERVPETTPSWIEEAVSKALTERLGPK